VWLDEVGGMGCGELWCGAILYYLRNSGVGEGGVVEWCGDVVCERCVGRRDLLSEMMRCGSMWCGGMW
jgi:hypothetical protein